MPMLLLVPSAGPALRPPSAEVSCHAWLISAVATRSPLHAARTPSASSDRMRRTIIFRDSFSGDFQRAAGILARPPGTATARLRRIGGIELADRRNILVL